MEKYSPFCLSLLNEGSLKNTLNPLNPLPESETELNRKKTVFNNDAPMMSRSRSVLGSKKI